MKQQTLTQIDHIFPPPVEEVTPIKQECKGTSEASTTLGNNEKFDFHNFSFDDFNSGSQYDVITNDDGATVPITAPRLF